MALAGHSQRISIKSRVHHVYIVCVRVATRRAYLLDTASRLRYRYLNVLVSRVLEGLQEFKTLTSATSRFIAESSDEMNVSHILT